jgi:CRP/FNR family cyclic AMP-dependent transcriptional regulator
MSRTVKKEDLSHVGILQDLDDAEISKLLLRCKRLEVQAGHELMTEGELGDTMYLFVKGLVDVKKNLTMKIGRKGFGSAEKSMVKLNAETVSFFGDMAMFEDQPRSATITAADDCVLYEISREQFSQFCDDHMDAGIKVLRRIASALCGRIRKGNEDVLKLTTALSIALNR